MSDLNVTTMREFLGEALFTDIYKADSETVEKSILSNVAKQQTVVIMFDATGNCVKYLHMYVYAQKDNYVLKISMISLTRGSRGIVKTTQAFPVLITESNPFKETSEVNFVPAMALRTSEMSSPEDDIYKIDNLQLSNKQLQTSTLANKIWQWRVEKESDRTHKHLWAFGSEYTSATNVYKLHTKMYATVKKLESLDYMNNLEYSQLTEHLESIPTILVSYMRQKAQIRKDYRHAVTLEMS